LYGIYDLQERKRDKSKFNSHTSLPFLHKFTLTDPVQFSFELIFVFRWFLFFFSSLSREQDEHVRPIVVFFAPPPPPPPPPPPSRSNPPAAAAE
jgi:hypothetical protein